MTHRAWQARPPHGLTVAATAGSEHASEPSQICFGGTPPAFPFPPEAVSETIALRATRLTVSYAGRAWQEGPLLLLDAVQGDPLEPAVEVFSLPEDVVDDPRDLLRHERSRHRVRLLPLLAPVPLPHLGVVLNGAHRGMGEGELEIAVAVAAALVAHPLAGIVRPRHEPAVREERPVTREAADVVDPDMAAGGW